jgi:soluble lytic murein transglycosylase
VSGRHSIVANVAAATLSVGMLGAALLAPLPGSGGAGLPTYGELVRGSREGLLRIERFLADASLEEQGPAYFLRGYYFLSEEHLEEALGDFEHPAVEGSPLAAFALLLRTEILLLLGRPEEAAALAEGAQDAPALRRPMFERAVEAMLRLGRVPEAHRRIADAPLGEAAQALWLGRAAEAYREQGCLEEAHALAREILTSFAATEAARRFETLLKDEATAHDASGFERGLDETFWRVRAHALAEDRRFADALEALARLGRKTSSDWEVEGLCLYRRGFYTKALPALRRSSSPRSRYVEARCYRRLRSMGKYAAALEKTLRSEPHDLWWAKAAFALAREREEEAGRILERVAAHAERTEDRGQALWTLAWRALRNDAPAQAGLFLENYLSLEENAALHWEERLRAEFWLAGALAAQGRGEESLKGFARIAENFPDHYYGVRSRLRLARASELEESPLPLPPIHETEAERNPVPPHLSGGVEVLLRLGLLDEARLWLGLLLKEKPCEVDLWLLKIRLEAKAGGARAALSAFNQAAAVPGMTLRALHGRVSEDTLRMMYPLLFWDSIVSRARAHRLDPLLVAAVIQQESSFDPRAVSRSGARGLMQLMPGTGRQIARKRREPYRLALLYDPDKNIDFGTEYLAGMLERFDGRVELALAAYNGGPNRAARWWRELGSEDIEVFVDDIPLGETRRYVKRVTMHYERYRRLYGKPS